MYRGTYIMKGLETRIIRIEKSPLSSTFILYVEVFSGGLIADEYEYQGRILLDDITQYDPKTSVALVQDKSH